MASRTVPVVLAAGAGTRFDGPTHKLDAELDGVPIADRSIRHALAADLGPVVVVTGATRPGLPTLSDELAAGLVVVVDNPDWDEGQSTSLQTAVRTARAAHAHAIVVGLADQPFVSAGAWRAVADGRAPIAVATYDGKLRNPVKLHRAVWPLLPTTGDSGARQLLRLRRELVERVPCDGSAADIDTLEDLRSWQNRSSTSSR